MRQTKLTFVLHHQPVELGLQLKVGEQEVDAAARLRDDEPHAVEVIAVLLGVVGGQDGT